MIVDNLVVTVRVRLSLWSAIKLRIAGLYLKFNKGRDDGSDGNTKNKNQEAAP